MYIKPDTKNPADVSASDGARTDNYCTANIHCEFPGRQPWAESFERWTLAAEVIRRVFADKGGAS